MKKRLFVSFLFVALIASGGVVFAATDRTETIKEKVAARKEAAKLRQCELVEERVGRKFSKLDTNSAKRVESFTKTREKLERFIERLEGKGYDVATLKADLVTFDSKVTKYKADFSVYTSLLRETKQFSCTKSESEFKAKLVAAREQQKVVQKDAVEIRTFYAKTFREHILELKSQQKVIENTTNETEETAETTEANTDSTTGGSNE